MTDLKKTVFHKRRIVTGIAVGGAVALSQWQKPIVQAIVLPAHAQTTGAGAGAVAVSAMGFDSGTATGITLRFT